MNKKNIDPKQDVMFSENDRCRLGAASNEIIYFQGWVGLAAALV